MTTNIWQTTALLVAFVGLALLGGRLLVAFTFNPSKRRRLAAALGILVCLLTFAALYTVLA